MTSETMSAFASRLHLHWPAIKVLISLVSLRVLLWALDWDPYGGVCVQDSLYCSHAEPGLIRLRSLMFSAETYDASEKKEKVAKLPEFVNKKWEIYQFLVF